MGTPLSIILANLTMEFIEADLMTLFPATLAFYKRYVNETFSIWQHSLEDFKSFFARMNQLLASIKFKVEWEATNSSSGDLCLAFLDMLVHRTNNGPRYAVYRKPTHTFLHKLLFSTSSQPESWCSILSRSENLQIVQP